MSNFKKLNSIINTMSWQLHKDPKTAGFYKDDKFIPISESILDTKITSSKSSSKIAIIWNNNKPVHFANFKGTTLRNFMNSVYQETQRKLSPKNSDPKIIYSLIGHFFKPETRKEMVNSYERGTLKVEKLLGDHYFFDGG